MREVLEIDQIQKARSLLHPVRVLLLHYLAMPHTCHELAKIMNVTQQRLNHHLGELKKAGLIRIVKKNRKANLLEAVYQRTSKAYWFSPRLAFPKKLKKRESQDRLALHHLMVMAESLQTDVVELLSTAGDSEVPNMGFEAEIPLKDEAEREAFTHDILRAFHSVAEKYQGNADSQTRYKIMVCAYPKV